MLDLTTRYLGLELANPLIVGSSTHTSSPEKIRQLAAAGAGAVVLKSIFEEQIRSDMSPAYDELAAQMHPEASDYLRADLPMEIGPEKYLERIIQTRKMVRIPVIASINCSTADTWTSYARKIESAGADALEVNVYDIPDGPRIDAETLESRHLHLVSAIVQSVRIPVAVKLAPYYTSLPHFVQRVVDTGVSGLVLFNRFFQPDVDIETLQLDNVVTLSRSEDIRLPLRWIALLRDQVSCSLCLTTGVHSSEGLIKALLAGADAAQVCSVLYRQSKDAIAIILDGLREWMERREFTDLAAFRGLLCQRNLEANRGFERAQYMKTLVGLE